MVQGQFGGDGEAVVSEKVSQIKQMGGAGGREGRDGVRVKVLGDQLAGVMAVRVSVLVRRRRDVDLG